MTYPEDRITARGAVRFCSGCSTWKVRDTSFTRTSDKRCTDGHVYYVRRCRECSRAAKPHEGPKVPLGRVKGTVVAMIEQVGFREAARRIGVTRTTLSYWLHLNIPHHGKPAKRVTRAKAAQIVAARVQLNEDIRAGRVVPREATDALRRTRAHEGRCSGCGTDPGNHTDGCELCWDRARKRAKREPSTQFKWKAA